MHQEMLLGYTKNDVSDNTFEIRKMDKKYTKLKDDFDQLSKKVVSLENELNARKISNTMNDLVIRNENLEYQIARLNREIAELKSNSRKHDDANLVYTKTIDSEKESVASEYKDDAQLSWDKIIELRRDYLSISKKIYDMQKKTKKMKESYNSNNVNNTFQKFETRFKRMKEQEKKINRRVTEMQSSLERREHISDQLENYFKVRMIDLENMVSNISSGKKYTHF